MVGAGVSGLTAAYMLDRAHEVTLFEQAATAGGHALTLDHRENGRILSLDTGFLVYNETTYPGFTAMLRELDVPTQPSEMSFSVRCDRCDLEYSTRGLGGLFAQPRNALRREPWRFLLELLRFYRDASRTMRSGDAYRITLGDFIQEHRYSDWLVRHHIVPLSSAVWSMPPGDIAGFPAGYFFRFLRNHGMLSVGTRHPWRTVSGGSRRYVDRLLSRLGGCVRLGTPVRAVRRDPDGVEVVDAGGDRHRFEKVVLACHANQSLALLADPSPDETAALSRFAYSENRIVVHRDPSVLPRAPRARASWNYATADCRSLSSPLTMTYSLNRLQSLDSKLEYCVSVNADDRISAGSVIERLTFEHPSYTFATLEGQQRLRAINGTRNTYYAGAHLGYGFHEDGWASGAAVARMLTSG